MCGIAGVVGLPGPPHGSSLVTLLSHELQHRGPDDHGYLVLDGQTTSLGRKVPDIMAAGATVLIHRRLSILDLTQAGWQPMGTPDGRYFVILNGEIYNYLELRRELEASGAVFRSQGDTEVLLAAYARWGTACLPPLVGMFAFVIVDTRERRLFLARDPFGIKPLYYAVIDGAVVFASEVKALLAYPGLQRRVDPERAYLYLRYGVTDHGGGTIVAGIRQLAAAHYLEVTLDGRRLSAPTRYWTLAGDSVQDISFKEAAERLRALFIHNVRLHLRSDVPVGAALSGGIDSSAIVATMRHVAGRELSLHTFSYIADDEQLSEERWVDIVGTATAANVHKVRSSARDLLKDLPNLIRAQGEPFGSTNIFAQYLVFREAAQHGITVMLDGQGADEMLAGYHSYLSARVASLIRSGRWVEAWRFGAKAARLPGMTPLSMAARSVGAMLSPRFQEPLRRLIGRDAVPPWLNRRWLQQQQVGQRVYGHTQGRRALIEELRKEIDDSSMPALLRYEDRNSMAFSIESRVPFLTPELVNFVLSLPEEYILAPDGTSKAIFRTAM